MKLRDHPWLSYQSARSWPPKWIWQRGDKYTRAIGEIGILKGVILSSVKPRWRLLGGRRPTCVLVMHHAGQEYVGVLRFEKSSFCRQVYMVLLEHLGEAIHQIGDIDLNDTL